MKTLMVRTRGAVHWQSCPGSTRVWVLPQHHKRKKSYKENKLESLVPSTYVMVMPLWRLTQRTLALWEEAEFASLSMPSTSWHWEGMSLWLESRMLAHHVCKWELVSYGYTQPASTCPSPNWCQQQNRASLLHSHLTWAPSLGFCFSPWTCSTQCMQCGQHSQINASTKLTGLQ